MKITKELDIPKETEDILHLRLEDQIHYVKETEGIRATGQLYLYGDCLFQSQQTPIEEVIELDILAPYQKLKGDDFSITIANYRYINQPEPLLEINLNIYGLDQPQEIIEELTEDIVEEVDENKEELIEDLFDDSENTMNTYHVIIVQKEDDYHRIALRYDVDEQLLREYNHHKNIEEGSILYLPETN